MQNIAKKSSVFTPDMFRPKIVCVYPPNNEFEFERWLHYNYIGCETDRLYLDILWTAYYVNNNYGNDLLAIDVLQQFIDGLNPNKKYFTCVQYDDGILNNVSGLDLLQFNMSKNIGVPIPLMCQPHPFSFSSKKRFSCNFIGSRTHPLRDSAEQLKNKEGYYISYDQHSIMDYCRVLHESLFTLAYRGYGLNSFRLLEAMQYKSIPVYVSDEFIIPFDVDFEQYGALIDAKDADRIDEILKAIPAETIMEKQDNLKWYYDNYYTYEGCMNQIIKTLENESP